MAAVELWLTLLVLGLAVLHHLLRRSTSASSKLNLPPGPPGVPVLGNLSVFAGSEFPHHALANLAKRYGPLMFLRLGSTPCIVATSPEVCAELFKHQDRVFASRPVSSCAEHCLYGGKDFGLAPYGDHWRQMRKVATLELLTARKITEFAPFRVAEVSAVVKAILEQTTIYATARPVNLRVMLSTLSFNFMTHICFTKRFFHYHDLQDHPTQPSAGKGPSAAAEEGKEFMHLMNEISMLLGVQLIGDFIPHLSFLDRFTGNFKPRMIKAHKRVDQFLSQVVKEHRENPKQENLDFVDVLLGLPGLNETEHLDDETIKAVLLDMILAGSDTSQKMMEWVLAEVIRHPDIAAKLTAELDAVVGKERLVTEADIQNLPYLQAVVKEGMRLHVVTPLLLPHESLEQTKIMGYDIPKGSTVFANVWAIHRDPAVWDNPLAFRPERFLNHPEIDVKGQHFQLLPFGAGRRGCPGIALGLGMVQYTLARLLQAFEWSPPLGVRPENVSLEESRGLNLTRAHVLEAVATPRLASLLYQIS